MAGDRPLNERQLRFIEAYLVEPNGAAAARAAGYAEKGCYVTAHGLLQDSRIQAAIAAARAERSARARKSADDVLQELERIGFASLRDVAAWDSGSLQLKDSDALEEAAAASVAEVKCRVTESGITVSIKQHSKLGALKLLAEHHGILKQKGGEDDDGATDDGIYIDDDADDWAKEVG